MKWLKDGDKNTKFFHASTIQRRGRNRVQRIQNDRGEWVEGKEETFQAVLQHYAKVYKSDNPTEFDSVLSCIPTLVTPLMNERLGQPFGEEEIK